MQVLHALISALGHALVTLSTALLVVVALHLALLLRAGRGAWAGLVGGAMAVLGACLLAADKGALCLTMSALDAVDEPTFHAMMPGLLAIFDKQGWVVLVWGMVLLPLGVAVQAVGLMRSGTWPTWQAGALLAGSLLIAAPDGMEIVNLTAPLALFAALAPEAVRLARGTSSITGGSATSHCQDLSRSHDENIDVDVLRGVPSDANHHPPRGRRSSAHPPYGEVVADRPQRHTGHHNPPEHAERLQRPQDADPNQARSAKQLDHALSLLPSTPLTLRRNPSAVCRRS